ncbi:MAG TPA: hypothetical protein VF520_04620 [Thermoleophilaceae bacterium]|jgi:hypothetical protein
MRETLWKLITAVVALYVFGATPAAADGEVRTATKDDGPDPTVVYDLEQVLVRFDRDAGRVELVVRFAQALPESQPNYTIDSASVSLDSRCPSSSAKGDTRVVLEWNDPYGSDPPGYYVRFQVRFRDSYTTQPATLSPDRRELTLTIDDPLLLQGADLKCVSASGNGRRFYDPTQPGGGPTYDSLAGDGYFDGFGTPEVLAPEDGTRSRALPPVLAWWTGNAPERALVEVPSESGTTGFVLDASRPGEFKATEQYGSERIRYRVAIAEGVTWLALLDHIVYRRPYTWSVERGDDSYGLYVRPTSPERKFTITPPEVTRLTARAKHRRGSTRTSPGSSVFTVASAPLARFALQITRRGKVVKTSKGKLDMDGDGPTLRYRWSCRRLGRHAWRMVVRDEYGGRLTKRGAFTVPSKPCRRPRRKKSTRQPSTNCDGSYPTVCIPPQPPDLDCPDIPYRDFRVRGSDPHGFDRDGDGIGCES